MCSCSGADWLFQKSVAWLKWSKNFSPRARAFSASIAARVCHESALGASRLHRASAAKGVRVITRSVAVDRLAHESVALVVVDRRHGSVDRNLVKVGAAEPDELRVRI